MTVEDIRYLGDSTEPWNCSFCTTSSRRLRSGSAGSSTRRVDVQTDCTDTFSKINAKVKGADVQADCADSLSKINDTLSTILAQLTSIKATQESIAADVARCSATLNAHSGQIEKNAEDISECRTAVADVAAGNRAVAEEVESLRDKVATIESDLVSKARPRLDEEAIREVADRTRRASNLILRGLPEPTTTDDLETQELDSVCQILRCVDPTSVSSIVSVHRIGQPRSNPRPVKVCFSNSGVPTILLRNKAKLSTSRFKKVSIADDKTPLQLKQLSELRKELHRRQENGEKDCTIKYVNGIPSIVALRQSKN